MGLRNLDPMSTESPRPGSISFSTRTVGDALPPVGAMASPLVVPVVFAARGAPVLPVIAPVRVVVSPGGAVAPVVSADCVVVVPPAGGGALLLVR